MPPRQSKQNPDGWCHYVEPYFGGGAVLFANNPEGISEVANDLNGDLMAFWSVLQNPVLFHKFQRILEAVPFSEKEYQKAHGQSPRYGDPEAPEAPGMSTAVSFFIRCRQSLAGRMDSFAPLSRNRVRRGMNEQTSAWLSAVEGLPAVHARMKRVVILCKDALQVITQQDGPKTLFYLDPSYLKETRTSKEVYKYEMTDKDHLQLLEVLCGIEGKFLLSGYPSPLYTKFAELMNWNQHEFDLPNNSSGGKTKKRMTEVVWANF